MSDALADPYSHTRVRFAAGVLHCAAEQGVRYGNCGACLLDGFLDLSDCLVQRESVTA